MPSTEPASIARETVDELLSRVALGKPPDGAEVGAMAAALPPAVQIALLRECVQRMPSLRAAGHDETSYAAGSLLYGLACELYTLKLPYDVSDVSALLRSSRHTCGHGSDISPPLDIAQRYMQKHGFSTEITAAVRAFVQSLATVGSSQANFARRRASIMLLADPEDAPESEPGWAAHFRAGLRNVDDAERPAWQRLILSMKANDVYVPPAVWKKTSGPLLASIPAATVLERIDGWTAVEGNQKAANVRTGGSHVLKHLVWLLDELSARPELEPGCDVLVNRIARTEWTPKDRAAKALIAAACYLARRPPEVAWESLQQLARWSRATPGKIGGIVRQYAIDHDQPIPADAVAAEPLPSPTSLTPSPPRTEERSWIRWLMSKLWGR